ncbi:putative S-adenosyl-L-methionine-dependent methyltransferase [Dioscorea sansibarensis]
MVWSPLHAMQAYMDTLQLCKDHYYCNRDDHNSSVVLEPKSMEFISALAAGNQAQLMADISSVPISPSTLALAVAAKQTGGLLLCIRPSPQTLQQTKTHLQNLHLFDVVDLKLGNPCEVLKQYHNIDFVVINNDHHHHQGCALSLLLLGLELSMNPNGPSVVVVMNNGGKRSSSSSSLSSSSCGHEVVRGLRGRGIHVESMTLPIGDHGMEVIKINGKGNILHHHHHHHQEAGRRSKRVFRVFDD